MAPKGAAFLWARREHQAWLYSPVISHGYGGGYVAEFDWTGTRDPSAYLCVPAAIAFRSSFGDQIIKSCNSALAAEAGACPAKTWQTRWWTRTNGRFHAPCSTALFGGAA